MPSRKERIAFAIFVKTPGLSPLKTRLAKSVGVEKANAFYLLSVEKIKNNLLSLHKEQTKYDIDCFWAVAENKHERHLQFWSDFPIIYQSQEDLGGRIHSVYDQLILTGYDKVILMGADSPQFNQSDYLSWCEQEVSGQRAVVGPTVDGGFYCFISSVRLSKALWSTINYSQPTTLQELSIILKSAKINIKYLPQGFDVDEEFDLLALKQYFSKSKTPYLLPSERQLVELVDSI